VLKQKGELQDSVTALRKRFEYSRTLRRSYNLQPCCGNSRRGGRSRGKPRRNGNRKTENRDQAALFCHKLRRRLLNAGDIEGAVRNSAAISSSPKYAAAHLNGVALRQQGKSEEAQEDFERPQNSILD